MGLPSLSYRFIYMYINQTLVITAAKSYNLVIHIYPTCWDSTCKQTISLNDGIQVLLIGGWLLEIS